MVTKFELLAAVQGMRPARSAWDRGVQAYAVDLAENLVNDSYVPDILPDMWEEVLAIMLNGADGWRAYSYGGCALVYNGDIAERLCTRSELRHNRGGMHNPNRYETWLDVQTHALYKAAAIVCTAYKSLNFAARVAGKVNG